MNQRATKTRTLHKFCPRCFAGRTLRYNPDLRRYRARPFHCRECHFVGPRGAWFVPHTLRSSIAGTEAVAEAHRRALDVVAATDAVWLKRDAVAIPERP
jgi:hypothetical protein